MAQLSASYPQASHSPNHQARAQIHRRPAGAKACYMQRSIPTTAVASYPPSAAQLWLNGRTCFCAVACVSVDDCDMNDTHLHPPEGESSDTYRQQQQRLTEGPGVHRPPAVVVMSMPHRPSDAICELCSEKQSQKRTTILRHPPRRRCKAKIGPTEKSPARLLQPYPGFFACLSHLLACHRG